MSKCVIYNSEDKEYKVGTQTSHCKRKGWILPFFCFTGVFIAIIIGYILFHFRKEQMEPILRPETFYQPRNSFFKSGFYNKHSPFKYLSYNPSMRYSGNISNLSGLKAMDGRKNYHNLEIPVNYINRNNINNNINNNVINKNSYQDLDPTIYPEYDNTVEIIDDNRTNFNGVNQMNPINSMNMSMNNINNMSYMNNINNMSMNNVNNMNNLSRNHSIIQNQYNSRISNYNEVPSHILSELDSTTTTVTTTTTSMTETNTERPSAKDNEYSIVSSYDDYYTESENYTNSYYNKTNIPPPQNRMINSYNPYIQQNNNSNNQVDPNQSYIFNNPPVELENSYIIGPSNDENMNNNNNFNDFRYNNNNSNNNISNYQPYDSSLSNLPSFRNNIMRQNQNPHHHMRNYSYSIRNTFNDASREELMRKSQSSKIHRRSYSYNDDINQYKRNQSYNGNNNVDNNDYNYNESFYNQSSDYSGGVTSKTLRSFIEKSNSNRQLNQSHSNISNNNPYSYIPSRPQSQNTILTPTSNNNSVLRRSPIPLNQKAYPSHSSNYILPSNDMISSFSITNNSTTITTTETSSTLTTTTDDDLTTESTTTEYSIYRRKGNRDNSSTHYIATPMNNLNNGNAPNITQKRYDNSYSYSNLRSNSRSHSHIQSYPEFQQPQQQQSIYYSENNNYNKSLNNENSIYSRRSGIRLNQSPSVSRVSSKHNFYKPSTLINPQGSIANYENSTNRSRTFYPSTVY